MSLKKRLYVIVVGVVVALLLAFYVPTPPDDLPGDDPSFSLGAKPAQGEWYYTCKTHRDRHTHYLREVVHVWKNIVDWRKGGRYYVRGTWASVNMNNGNQFASDRRTYDCTGR